MAEHYKLINTLWLKMASSLMAVFYSQCGI